MFVLRYSDAVNRKACSDISFDHADCTHMACSNLAVTIDYSYYES